MPRCLQCGACPVLLFLCCLGFFLAFKATAANTVQEGTPVDISKMLGEVHGKMFDYVYMKSESLILTDSTANLDLEQLTVTYIRKRKQAVLVNSGHIIRQPAETGTFKSN
uniref:Putative secreted protein n=1 Tax=Ixodes ricinus TaxID=34613 RepID=V5GPA4_IXORI